MRNATGQTWPCSDVVCSGGGSLPCCGLSCGRSTHWRSPASAVSPAHSGFPVNITHQREIKLTVHVSFDQSAWDWDCKPARPPQWDWWQSTWKLMSDRAEPAASEELSGFFNLSVKRRYLKAKWLKYSFTWASCVQTKGQFVQFLHCTFFF